MDDLISRQEAISELMEWVEKEENKSWSRFKGLFHWTGIKAMLECLPSAQSDSNKYEYHYDHTDCIWYRPEARNRCPVTCAQYRDGWNDAMNYIFRDGKGYRPYKRDEKYGE